MASYRTCAAFLLLVMQCEDRDQEARGPGLLWPLLTCLFEGWAVKVLAAPGLCSGVETLPGVAFGRLYCPQLGMVGASSVGQHLEQGPRHWCPS